MPIAAMTDAFAGDRVELTNKVDRSVHLGNPKSVAQRG
jgi:hypothetical protein